MGFSTIAASVILFGGLLFVAGTAANAFFEAQRATEHAHQERVDREESQRATDIRLDSVTFQGNRVHIYITNTGGNVLSVSKIQFIVDGTWRNTAITQQTVDNDPNTDIWSPGEQLYTRLDISPKPARVWVITETGRGVVAEP